MAQLSTAVYQQLRTLPTGCVTSYGQLALQAGYPGYARQVGAILRGLPHDSDLPWHRVLRADGRLPFTAGTTEFDEQKIRLLKEGIQVDGDRVSRRYFRSCAVS
ncbi:MAG: MGMT family protein [Oceanospirillaceae bacterium]|nr:MGMT family protein [Oceanospirillaceae bacterium]